MTISSQHGDLARRWWAVHGPNGTIAAIGDWSPQVTDEVAEVDRTVDLLSNEPDSLASLIAALVKFAPAEASLAFLGTFLLEDITDMSRAQILGSVDAAGLSDHERQAVLSGYVHRQD